MLITNRFRGFTGIYPMLIVTALFLGSNFFFGCAASKPKPEKISELSNDGNISPSKVKLVSNDGEMASDNSEFDDETSDFIDDETEDFTEDFMDEETDKNQGIIADPLKDWNRAVFFFNDRVYFLILKPMSQGYKFIVPYEIRFCLRNFFFNLSTPVRFFNCVFQGKIRKAGSEVGRFFVNRTVGVLGFGNPAQNYPVLNPSPEDLGQTFARYKIGHGCYLVLPFLGPSSLRDTVGMVGDFFLNPITYNIQTKEINIGRTVLDTINETSFRIGDYEALKEAAIEPYEAFHNFYYQYRKKLEKN